MNVPSIASILVIIYGVLVSTTGGIRLVPRVIAGVTINDRCRSPYNSMVALQFNSNMLGLQHRYFPITFCSAVMVTDTYLITTAKCLFKMAENQNQVVTAMVGERDTIMRGEPEEQRIAIQAFKVHYDYNRTTGANNIGIIKLAAPAKLGRCVKPAVPMEKDPNVCEDVDDTCQIVGWGTYSDTTTPMNSRLPRTAAVTVYSDLISVLLASSSTNTDPPPPVGTLYAEAINPIQKACIFDWGGLVSCKRNGYNVLKGIISNHNCGSQTNSPILITDIPFYQRWIDTCTTKWQSCATLQ